MVREEGGGGRARRAVDRTVDAPLGACVNGVCLCDLDQGFRAASSSRG